MANVPLSHYERQKQLMKNKLRVIQINGFRGILFVIGAIACLAAGFVAFPGIVLKICWNFVSGLTGVIPSIGVLQGVLLWGIVVVSYFAFKGKGFFVEFKSADELSRSEMDAVMEKIRMEHQADIITKSIMRARELEAQAKKEFENNENIDLNEIENVENIEKIETSSADKFLS